MSAPEKRRHPRQRKDAPLILLRDRPQDRHEGAELRDVSMGGLAFETAQRLKPGDPFSFALFVPTRGWVEGSGVVCWSRQEGRGWLCGASISVENWGQERLLRKWLKPSAKGLLKYFFPQ